jgi:hypothetical protein
MRHSVNTMLVHARSLLHYLLAILDQGSVVIVLPVCMH